MPGACYTITLSRRLIALGLISEAFGVVKCEGDLLLLLGSLLLYFHKFMDLTVERAGEKPRLPFFFGIFKRGSYFFLSFHSSHLFS